MIVLLSYSNVDNPTSLLGYGIADLNYLFDAKFKTV